MTIKFTFYFKNGRTFDYIQKFLDVNKALEILKTCKTVMKEDISGVVCFEDCVIRMSEVVAVEWEVLDNEQEEEEQG